MESRCVYQVVGDDLEFLGDICIGRKAYRDRASKGVEVLEQSQNVRRLMSGSERPRYRQPGFQRRCTRVRCFARCLSKPPAQGESQSVSSGRPVEDDNQNAGVESICL